jgi:hypothetical protein
MRLWCINPCYLDTKGLVACWREGLLARKVLRGETKGYRNHPQLERFKGQADPVSLVDTYLLAIYDEATKRGFAFKREKIGPIFAEQEIIITDGQLEYEIGHLKGKLEKRDKEQYERIAMVKVPRPHPIFRVVSGEVEPWEKVGQK